MKHFTITLPGTLGTVSAELLEAGNTKTLVVLAHGAGAGMNHAFMTKLSEELATRNISTLRYNFPYMENGKKRPDVPAVATKTVELVLQQAHAMFPKAKIFAAGKSFGGRMTSHYLAKHNPGFVQGMIFYGFPLHPAGAPATSRADHLKDVPVPMLFLQGTRDALAEKNLVVETTGKLKNSTLVFFEGADHAFKPGKREFIAELADATRHWITKR